MPDSYEGGAGRVERAVWPQRDPKWATMTDAWLMTLPNQAPGNAWDQFLLQCITLADLPGVPPANKQSPEMTHELLVVTLDPKRRWTPTDAKGGKPYVWFGRPTVSAQFRVRSDDMARGVTEDMARGCADGLLVAETTVLIYPLAADGGIDTSPGKGEEKVILELVMEWRRQAALCAEHHMTGGHHGTQN